MVPVMSDRAILLALTWMAVAILVMLVTGCSWRDSREMSIGGGSVVQEVSAPEVPIGATPLGVVPTQGNRKALNLCLLFPPSRQLQCVLALL